MTRYILTQTDDDDILSWRNIIRTGIIITVVSGVAHAVAYDAYRNDRFGFARFCHVVLHLAVFYQMVAMVTMGDFWGRRLGWVPGIDPLHGVSWWIPVVWTVVHVAVVESIRPLRARMIALYHMVGAGLFMGQVFAPALVEIAAYVAPDPVAAWLGAHARAIGWVLAVMAAGGWGRWWVVHKMRPRLARLGDQTAMRRIRAQYGIPAGVTYAPAEG